MALTPAASRAASLSSAPGPSLGQTSLLTLSRRALGCRRSSRPAILPPIQREGVVWRRAPHIVVEYSQPRAAEDPPPQACAWSAGSGRGPGRFCLLSWSDAHDNRRGKRQCKGRIRPGAAPGRA